MVRKGWRQVTLGDIALFQGGSQPPLSVFSSQKKAGYIRLVQIRDYKTDKHATYIPEKLAKRFCKHRLTRAHREKQLKMSCQALHNAPPNRT